MKEKFNFSLLRYVCDPLTQEFVNIGVVLFSPAHNFIRASFTNRYGRISKMFGRIDGASFRATTGYIERKVSEINDKMERGQLFHEHEASLQSILAEVVPPDDSSIRFSYGGVGITENPSLALDGLFERYVARYENPSENVRREDNDIWRIFQEPLKAKPVYSQFVSKTISAPNYEYQFDRSWKNGIWHVYEPVSFDLADERSISEKAVRWLGRSISLSKSSEPFKLFLLLGEPADPRLGGAFQKAKNVLAEIPGKREFIPEKDAEQFAEQVEGEFQQHLLEVQD
jgi:hypothetical protein